MNQNYHIPAGPNEFLYPAADRLYSIILSHKIILYSREYQLKDPPFASHTIGVWRQKRK